MEKITKALSRFLEINAYLGVACIFAMLLVTVTNVILRNFFNMTVRGSEEITVNLMAGLVFLGLAWAAWQGIHISVDLLEKLVARRKLLNTALFCLNHVLALGVAVIASWQAYETAVYHLEMDITTWVLGVPYYPFHLLTSYGFALLAVAAILLLLNVRKHVPETLSEVQHADSISSVE